jgi:hypothetical protein
VVADYLRHPSAPENVALETLLVAADLDLRAGDYQATARRLDAVNTVLDALEAGDPSAFSADPLAADHLAIALAAIEAGYEVQQIFLDGEIAVVKVTAGSTGLLELMYARESSGWVRTD